jgi:hypothetical protein
MKKPKGIRKLYHKGRIRNIVQGRMNSLRFHEIQRQIEYYAG